MDKERCRVLIVDDIQINRIVLASLLAARGIMSDQAESGAGCLSLCQKNEYDLILLDHRMPDMDGAETLMKLKELFENRCRSIPVICHTTEDGRSNISVIKYWLSPAYNVLCFTDAPSVMKGFSTVTPYLILLDLEMPDTDGCALLKMIREVHPELCTPIIFLTGNNDRDIVIRVLEYKPDGYLLKTSQKDAILDMIRRFFAESMFRQTKEQNSLHTGADS